jgi:rhodanese-related sulfurtransferase
MPTQTITIDEWTSRQHDSAALIDVRTPAEYRQSHAEGARLYPLEKLDVDALRPLAEKQALYLLCNTGTRARAAAQKLESAGIENVVVVEGGTNAWEEAGFPVVRGKKTISLERQVRIAAGSLVLIGVILGWFAHRGFFGLSAFVGAGLLFAGLTDTCGMAILLARAPWNQVKVTTSACGNAKPQSV